MFVVVGRVGCCRLVDRVWAVCVRVSRSRVWWVGAEKGLDGLVWWDACSIELDGSLRVGESCVWSVRGVKGVRNSACRRCVAWEGRVCEVCKGLEVGALWIGCVVIVCKE